MPKVNHYKVAPTWLYHDDKKEKIFSTQAEVDAAWEDGWFGPPWLKTGMPKPTDGFLISDKVFKTKRLLKEAVEADERYAGLKINLNSSVATTLEKVKAFEEAAGIAGE